MDLNLPAILTGITEKTRESEQMKVFPMFVLFHFPGRILQTSSNIVFILMLILLAKGYTVVRGRLTSKAVLKITIFINLYIVAMVVMFIWEGVVSTEHEKSRKYGHIFFSLLTVNIMRVLNV